MNASKLRSFRPSRVLAFVLFAVAVLGLAYLLYGGGDFSVPWAANTELSVRSLDLPFPGSGDFSLSLDAGAGRAVLDSGWGGFTIDLGW